MTQWAHKKSNSFSIECDALFRAIRALVRLYLRWSVFEITCTNCVISYGCTSLPAWQALPSLWTLPSKSLTLRQHICLHPMLLPSLDLSPFWQLCEQICRPIAWLVARLFDNCYPLSAAMIRRAAKFGRCLLNLAAGSTRSCLLGLGKSWLTSLATNTARDRETSLGVKELASKLREFG